MCENCTRRGATHIQPSPPWLLPLLRWLSAFLFSASFHGAFNDVVVSLCPLDLAPHLQLSYLFVSNQFLETFLEEHEVVLAEADVGPLPELGLGLEVGDVTDGAGVSWDFVAFFVGGCLLLFVGK